MDDCGRRYDRAFLLSEEKRNHVLALWEVQQYGLDSYADADYVCVYGMTPAQWYGRGIRLLARTAVECVRDAFGALIAQDVARVMQHAPPGTTPLVIDPFAGSCNSLYWLLRQMPEARGLAFERDATIFELTTQNIGALDREIQLIRGDYQALLTDYTFPPHYVLIVFVAPPWGEALHVQTGLDLRRTQPPIGDIVDDLDRVYHANPMLYVMQVHQSVEPSSLATLRARFAWSELRIYDINTEGMKQGVLLGTSRWAP